MRQTKAGDYEAIEDREAQGGRAARVTGPTQEGRLGTLARCWTFEDAERLARRMDEKVRER